MSNIVKKYQSGKIEASIWKGEFEGNPTYQFKFQKSYKKQDGTWNNTDFFGIEDIMNINALCTKLIQSNIKEKAMNQNQNQNQNFQQNQTTNLTARAVSQVFSGDEEIPF